MVSMNAIARFSIIPIGVGVSQSEDVTTRGRVLVKIGQHDELHADGTNPESE